MDAQSTSKAPVRPRAADAYSQLWRRGRAPDLAQFLASAGPLPATEARKILEIDQWERRQQGQRVPAEAYARLLPPDATPDDHFALIYGEFLVREALGEQPDAAEFLRRFPHHANRLREQLEMHRALGQLPGPESTPTAPAVIGGLSHASTVLDRPPAVPGYELLGELGRGGMGVVYRARHLALERPVALKVMRSGDYAEGGRRERFRREAEAVARLQHPNVVQIFEVGEHHGQPYLALEFVEGGSLAQRIGGAPQPSRTAALVVTALAHAVQHAHEHGIVHRDLKPANVLLTRDGTPKITDFGLARRLDGPTGQTESGDVVGTPSYMAPEQAGGKGRDAGPAADIFALGAILYELLVGRPPFRGETPMDTLLQVLGDDPVPPRRLQPKVPRDLETICLKCLAKAPAKRYATAQALGDDLDRFLAGKPIQARPTPRWERVWKMARRHPVAVVLLVALVIVTFTGFALVTGQWLRAEEGWGQARLETDRANREKKAADWERENAVKAATREADAARKERRARQEMQLAASRLMMQTGLAQADQGETARGLLWLARALEQTPEDAPDQQDYLRRSLGAWGGHLHRHQFVLGPREMVNIYRVELAPDGRTALLGPGQARLYDLRSGKRLGNWQQPVGSLAAVAFSADGSRLLIGGEGKDRTAQLWDTATGKLLGRLPPHPADISGAAFNPKGASLLTVSRDHAARLWNAATFAPIGDPLPHRGAALAAGFSPDGTKVVTEDRQARSARLWDAATGKEVGEPLRHGGAVLVVAFSPSGKVVATGSLDRTARLWDADTGKPLGEPLAHPGPIRAVRFSPDGKMLVTAAGDRVFRWDVDTGKQRDEPLHPREFVYGLAFSPNGRCLLSTGVQSVRLWDAVTGAPLGQPFLHRAKVKAAVFSPDGRTVVTATDGGIRRWNLADGNVASEPLIFPGRVRAAGFAPDGKSIWTAGSNARPALTSSVRLWDAATHKPIGEPFTHRNLIPTVVYAPNGKVILAASHDGTARLWDAVTGRPVSAVLEHGDAILGARFLPRGDRFLTWGRTTIRFWDAPTGKAVDEPLSPPKGVGGVTLSPDGKALLVRCGDGSARLWQVTPLRPIGEPLRHFMMIGVARFSPDSKTILTGDVHGTARLWDAATAKPRTDPLPCPDGLADPTTFRPDGKQILVVNQIRNTARLLDVSTGKWVGDVLRHQGRIHIAVFRPNGKQILTASDDRTARLWDAANGKPVGEPLAHPAPVRSAAFSPDGKLVVTTSTISATLYGFQEADSGVHFWDAATGKPLGMPFRHRSLISQVAFHPDGKQILVGSEDGTVRLWNVPVPLAGKPEEFIARLQVDSGMELDNAGAFSFLDGAAWWKRWEQLRKPGGR